MPKTFPSPSPWYREPWPWFLMSFPLTAVIAGIATWILAVRSNDGLVVDDYYKQGLTINQRLARDELAGHLQLRAKLAVGTQQISVQMQAREGVTLPERLRLVLSHPTRAGDDQVIELQRGTAGYQAAISLQGTGLRTVLIEDPERSWRLLGNFQVPLDAGELISHPPAN